MSSSPHSSAEPAAEPAAPAAEPAATPPPTHTPHSEHEETPASFSASAPEEDASFEPSDAFEEPDCDSDCESSGAHRSRKEKFMMQEISRLRKEIQAERVLRARMVVERNLLTERMTSVSTDLTQERSMNRMLKTSQARRRPASRIPTAGKRPASTRSFRVAMSPSGARAHVLDDIPEDLTPDTFAAEPRAASTPSAINADLPETVKLVTLQNRLTSLRNDVKLRDDELVQLRLRSEKEVNELTAAIGKLREDLRHMRAMSREPERRLREIQQRMVEAVRGMVDEKARDSQAQTAELALTGALLKHYFETLLDKFQGFEQAAPLDDVSMLGTSDEVLELFGIFQDVTSPIDRRGLLEQVDQLYAEVTRDFIGTSYRPMRQYSARAQERTPGERFSPERAGEAAPAGPASARGGYWRKTPTQPTVAEDAHFMLPSSAHASRMRDADAVKQRYAAISARRRDAREAEREGIRRRKKIFFGRASRPAGKAAKPRVWKKFEEATNTAAPKPVPLQRRVVTGLIVAPPVPFPRVLGKVEIDVGAIQDRVFALPELPDV